MRFAIVTPSPTNEQLIRQAAQLLVDAFREHWPEAWPTFDEALQEVNEMLAEGKIYRAAVDDDENLLGIIGGISQYDGNV